VATLLAADIGACASPPVPKAPAFRAFYVAAALLFLGSAAATIAWCGAMSRMGEMSMPGEWTMSMAWMRMPGQDWFDAAVPFEAMWILMTLAMMLPAVSPLLARLYGGLQQDRCKRAGLQAALVLAGYLVVWAGIGIVAYAVGTSIADRTMQLSSLARAAPFASGAAITTAGAMQFAAWKKRVLRCCRAVPPRSRRFRSNAAASLQQGLVLGTRCAACCSNLTLVLLVAGIMDLRVMALVSIAIAAERLTPNPVRVAQGTGALLIGIGLFAASHALAQNG
jgi:predicted metal-binding membrane protein